MINIVRTFCVFKRKYSYDLSDVFNVSTRYYDQGSNQFFYDIVFTINDDEEIRLIQPISSSEFSHDDCLEIIAVISSFLDK